MRYLLLLASLLTAVLSLGAHAGLVTHVTLLVPAAVMLWFTTVTWRPLRPCRHCDGGKNWDNTGENYGKVCPGAFAIPFTGRVVGSCEARGEVLRPSARFLRLVGAGHHLRNLPESMRGKDEG